MPNLESESSALQQQSQSTETVITDEIPTSDPVSSTKKKIPAWIIIAIVTVVSGITLTLVFSRSTPDTQSSNNTDSNTPAEKITLDPAVIADNTSPTETATWINFTNQTGEVQFSYPDTWQVSETTISASGSSSPQTETASQQQIKLQLEDAQILIATNITQAPRVPASYQGEAFTLDGHRLFKFTYLDPYTQTKQIGLANSSYNFGFFSLGDKHYEIFLSYPTGYTSEQEQQVQNTFTQILQSMKLPKQTPLVSQDWQNYIGAGGVYTIKYPAGWRQVETVNFTGFGPIEIGEDIIMGVSIYDTSDKTRTKVKAEIGKQFADRRQTSEVLFVAGLKAEKVVTTTPSYPDWYSESIFITSGDRLYVIGNGAQRNEQLQKMLQQRMTNPTTITFEDFYNSFRLQGI